MRNQEFHKGVDGLKSLGTPELKLKLHQAIFTSRMQLQRLFATKSLDEAHHTATSATKKLQQSKLNLFSFTYTSTGFQTRATWFSKGEIFF